MGHPKEGCPQLPKVNEGSLVELQGFWQQKEGRRYETSNIFVSARHLTDPGDQDGERGISPG